MGRKIVVRNKVILESEFPAPNNNNDSENLVEAVLEFRQRLKLALDSVGIAFASIEIDQAIVGVGDDIGSLEEIADYERGS